jgi:intron-binding protein aquarius
MIWLGNSGEHSVVVLQSALGKSNSFNELSLYMAVPSQYDLVKSLEVLHKLGFQFGLQYQTVDDFARVQLPLMYDRWCDVGFDLEDHPPILPEAMKLTPNQQAAVVSACFLPLTLIVGPPGTGKTETVVAIARVLYRNFHIANWPDRILICAHSNAALDQVLCDIAADKEYKVLRFGAQPTCQAASDLTVEGRILNIAAQLAVLLSENKSWLRCPDFDIECYINLTSEYAGTELTGVRDFHWTHYDEFGALRASLERRRFDGNRSGTQRLICDRCETLARPYSEIREGFLRDSFVLGSTITSLCRRIDELIDLNVSTVIVEEAAKILETEMISFLLLHPSRLILIGDQAQLRPLVLCDDVRLLGRFSQSLFERLQRLGVRTIMLNKQGRARPEIAELYRDRYPEQLRDLKVVSQIPDIPFIDRVIQWVDCHGRGVRPETNDEEAGFVYEFLRRAKLTGRLDLKLVSVITPYNAQKRLICELCQKDDLLPRDVCTIDEFQGKQNLVILISLVSRTPSLFMRDQRRITVLVSRARSRLVIFGNLPGFREVPEWKAVIDAISKSNKLNKFCFDRKCYSRVSDMVRDNDELPHLGHNKHIP